MNLLNIANFKRKIYLFTRDSKGKQIIKEDNNFYPYFFEPDETGSYTGYDGVKLKKVIVSEPSKINSQRTPNSYSADIKFVNNYLIHGLDKIEACPIKYLFLDIEVLCKEFPDANKAPYPISCITIYNSFSKEYQTWWVKDFENEEMMLKDFCFYIHGEAPDIILAWNVNFDYIYLYNRIRDFAKKISPLGFCRYGEEQTILYPAGISIVDYLTLYRKVNMREPTYALDYIAQKHLKEKSWGDTVFGELNERTREKNINDVKRMVKLEEQNKLIPYYDELRRLTKVKWEDLYYNSRIVEMLLLEEAKKQNIILPSKVRNAEKANFQGATRETTETGAVFNIGKFDLTSAYPSMIVNFCLDSQNIDPVEAEDNINIHGVYFRQNKNALLPSVVKRILTLKDELKIRQKKDSSFKQKYDAIKSVVNSTFGVMGNQFFRLYDNRIASSITYLVRDLIHYTKDRLEKENYKVLYWDTDSVFVSTKEDISKMLNQYIQDWGKQYGKEGIDLGFEYEGYFEKLFLLGKCHYFGYIHGKTEPEIKGVEIKRNNSSKYESKFQRELLDKVLNKENKEDISNWIESEKEKIKDLSIFDISFPCKIQSKKYKNFPIFVRAYELTQKINPKFKIRIGELFYYIFVKPIYKTDDVLAFSKENNDFIEWKNHIDWSAIIKRSILNKAENIFDALGWSKATLYNKNQLTF